MALIQFGQIKGGSQLQKDVETLKAKPDTKNLVFAAKTMKRGDSTVEIFFPYNGTCTHIWAGIGTHNDLAEIGELQLEVQSCQDEVWNTISVLSFPSDALSVEKNNLNIQIQKGLMRVKATKTDTSVTDLSVIAEINIEAQ